MAHPINDPLYNKLDYIRNGMFSSARTQFALLLEEGCTVQQLAIITGQMQSAIARAYTAATMEVVSGFAGQVPQPPNWNTFPDPPAGEAPPADDNNPFR
jgi:hypothetical protein